MKRRDDDDGPTSSSSEYFTRADKGKELQQMRKAEQKGKLLKLQRDVLRGTVQQDAATSGTEEERHTDEQQPKTFGTKTREQEVQEQKEGGKEKPTAEKIIAATEEHERVQKAAGVEDQPDMTA